MRRRTLTPGGPPGRLLLAALVGLLAALAADPAPAPAQIATEGAATPHWIWHPGAGVPAAETRYFRNTLLVKEHGSKLALDITADNRFVAYLDGEEILRGDDWHTVQNATATLAAGTHVLAIEATNEAPGAAGLLVRGSLQPLGQVALVHTGPHWKSGATVPAGDAWKAASFDDSAWAAAADLGPLGQAPWGQLAFGGDDPAGRFKVPAGFRVQTVAPAGLTGSAVSFAFDHKGRPCVGIERGPIVRLADADRDGTFEGRVVITPQMKNCQGLYFDVAADGKVTLWAVGDGPAGTGIYRLADADGDADEVYETVLHHVPTDGMGEHGPHAIRRGPDGTLYFNAGNHAHLKDPVDPRSPVNAAFLYEGELLPRYGDPRGHAVKIRAPGGEIYRSDDEGKTWQRIVAGFRNQYDFAFNRAGDLFSFDSDMEWDVGLPWYRPVRVNFCPPGAELGWRTGSGVWPAYFYDSLPATLDVGRGSPTGVTFYQGNAFPKEYDDAFIYLDWSQGRILAARLEPAGAAYGGRQWELVTGQPLNCTDVEVGPDGALYFTTGGRGTLGGLYRVSYDGPARAEPTPAAVAALPAPLREALAAPGLTASFVRDRLAAIRREAGPTWDEALARLARDPGAPAASRVRALDLLATFGPAAEGQRAALMLAAKDAEPAVRAKAVQLLGMASGPEVARVLTAALADRDPHTRRRACEALVRSRVAIPVPALLPLLADPDRWVRTGARVAIEHGQPEAHVAELLAVATPRASLEAMLAIVRATPLTAASQAGLFDRQRALLADESLSPTDRVDLLRLISLTYQLGPQKVRAGASEAFREALLPRFVAANAALGTLQEAHERDARNAEARETGRLLAFLGEPAAVPALLAGLADAAARDDRTTQIHYVYCLRAIPTGWTPEGKRQLWAWYETASRWDGGFSFLGYLDFMAQELVAVMTEAERGAALKAGAEAPFPTRVLVRTLDLEARPELAGTLSDVYRALAAAPSNAAGNDLRAAILEKLGASPRPEVHAALRGLAAADPGRRDVLARALAIHPEDADLPLLAAGLESRDATTRDAALRALGRLEAVPDGPEPLRALLRMARRVGPPSGRSLNALAARWTGTTAPAGDFETALAAWERLYAERHPGGPALAEAGEAKRSYTLAQLDELVVRSGRYRRGRPDRGLAVLTRAKCLDCHKLGDQGAGLGPDLTTVSSRFRPLDLIESIVAPSKVISDQYKPVTIATADGRVLNGMPAGGDAQNLLLLLSDGTKVTLPRADIDEQKESALSVMPEGLLDGLSPAEIADLVALFEAQPRVAAPAAAAPR
jgi:putative membrane-bound dehydrogenase-like protein